MRPRDRFTVSTREMTVDVVMARKEGTKVANLFSGLLREDGVLTRRRWSVRLFV